MAAFTITDLNPKKATIKPGGKITLKYKITGDKNTPVKITYTLSPDNNVMLKKGGTKDKKYSYSTTLTNPPETISDEFEIIKEGDKPNASWDEIDIEVINENDHNKDTATFTVNFS